MTYKIPEWLNLFAEDRRAFLINEILKSSLPMDCYERRFREAILAFDHEHARAEELEEELNRLKENIGVGG